MANSKCAIPVFDVKGNAEFHCFKLLKNERLGKLIKIVRVENHAGYSRGFEYTEFPSEKFVVLSVRTTWTA
jgi:hypothetical protein